MDEPRRWEARYRSRAGARSSGRYRRAARGWRETPIESSEHRAEYVVVDNVDHAAEPQRASGRAHGDPDTTVHKFLGALMRRYQHLQTAPTQAALNTAVVEERLSELVLAEAAVRHAQPAQAPVTPRPPQVAVIGPTQTGKSTVVNLLLGRHVAEVSPLAGYTVHPEGFWLASGGRSAGWVDGLFPGWTRCEPSELSRDRLDAYALPPCVVWDTPDFDSLAARTYRRGVLEVAALADVVVLVLSKEKYSDLSVWTMLRLLEPLGRPLVICLNKLTSDATGVVAASLRQRLQQTREDGEVPIATVEHLPDLCEDGGLLPAHAADGLRERLRERLAAAASRDRTPGARTLILRHWDDWITPLRAEHAAVDSWVEQVDTALAEFLDAYRRDYLDHPQRYDSFRRAAVELLRLLEIPKIGGLVARARRVATWPARQIVSAGRSLWAQRRRGRTFHDLGTEAAVLVEAAEGLLTALQRDAGRRCDASTPGYAVWRAIAQRLERDEARLRQVFRAAIEEHHRQVTHEIQAAANNLYVQLSQQPTRLAALRAARATMDVGYLLLAVKTGGLTPLDVVWAPATFGVTSLLMEGIAGLQMGQVARELKKRQHQAVQTVLLEGAFRPELRSLAENLDAHGLFGIAPERLAEATAALHTWGQTSGNGRGSADDRREQNRHE
jgi:hypothetical protein